MRDFILERPQSIHEALGILKKAGGRAMVKSGGTDLIVWLHKSLVNPDYVIDLTKIEQLKGIEISKEWIEIKALATLNEVASHPSVKERLPALLQACLAHSDPLIRNRATVVGNVCSAIPSGDLIAPLLCYGAVVEIAGTSGNRTLRIDDFITGPKQMALAVDEIVTAIKIALPEGKSAGCYLKIGRREALDIAQAAVCCTAFEKVTREFRISFCAVSPRPVRAIEAERLLNGTTKMDSDIVDRAVKLAMEAVNPITDVRASREYRLAMVEELTRRAIKSCVEQLEGGGPT